MRLLLYNIRYATGTGLAFHLPLPGAGYLRSSPRVLEGITRFIREQSPDLVGLVEVDTGSIRTGMVNQAEYIAQSLGHYTAYQCKYGTGSFNHRLPIVRKQSNALLASPNVTGERFVAAVERLHTGDPNERETQIGPLARDDLRESLEEQLRRSRRVKQWPQSPE